MNLGITTSGHLLNIHKPSDKKKGCWKKGWLSRILKKNLASQILLIIEKKNVRILLKPSQISNQYSRETTLRV